MLLMILIKYVRTRRRLHPWNFKGQSPSGRPVGGSTGYPVDDTTAASGSRTPGARKPRQPKGLYDRWLLTRFSIAFVCLCAFEVNNVIVQFTGHKNIEADVAAPGPDLSASRARRNFALLMPGAAAAPLAFVTFGTTRPFRERMLTTFVPAWWRERREEGSAAGTTLCSHGASAMKGNDVNSGNRTWPRSMSVSKGYSTNQAVEVEMDRRVLVRTSLDLTADDVESQRGRDGKHYRWVQDVEPQQQKQYRYQGYGWAT